MLYYRFLQNAESEQPEWLDDRSDFFVLDDAEGTSWLYLPLANLAEAESILKSTPSFQKFEPIEIKDYVDWGVQWSTHSPDFQNYRLEIDLLKYTSLSKQFPPLYLEAGPGFGDLSHPTTRLTLSMMAQHVKEKDVIDIGCGSGILSLAAILLGAKSAYGIDIDPEAILHAKTNALLNGLDQRVSFFKPEEFHIIDIKKEPIIVMNMIRTQQREAWLSLPQLHTGSAIWLTSGILASEREAYLQECIPRGWSLVEEQQQGDWMAFQFSQCH